MAQKNDVTGCTHDEIGYYVCPLNTTDTGTLGNLKVMVHQAGSLPAFHDFMIVTANVYDTLCSTDAFDVNVASQANIDFGALQKTSLNAATPTVTLAASAVDAVWDEVLSGHGVADSAGLALRNLLKIGKNKWSYVGTVFTIFNDNGVDVLYSFNLDVAAKPTVRTPV